MVVSFVFELGNWQSSAPESGGVIAPTMSSIRRLSKGSLPEIAENSSSHNSVDDVSKEIEFA